ncbi:MAG: UpxY family transcription antiterminator [Prevotella sp.]|nr:UpxY family transcription antiterminator [Prevotella sp.]MDY3248065.1 UpxY family transcription antiterminator [Prevotella sp.]
MMTTDQQALPTSESVANWGGRVTETVQPWYAVRLFTLRLREVADWFAQAGMAYFVPMEYREVVHADGGVGRVLSPVVRNLIFIAKDRPETEVKALIATAPFRLSVLRKGREDIAYYEIPHAQMREFQTMCNPAIEMKRYVTADEARVKSGQPVTVTHGPLRGLTGRLVRASKKYYLLKEVPGMAVMIKVSRWCCHPLQQK